MSKKGLNLIGHMEEHTSYAHVCNCVVDILQKQGFDLALHASDIDEFVVSEDRMDERLRSLFKPLVKEWPTFVFMPPCWKTFDKFCRGADLVYTLWETDKLEKEAVTALNRAKNVATSTDWGTDVFEESGVKVPVYKLNLTVNSRYGLCRQLPLAHTFLAAGRPGSGVIRKGLLRVVAAFLMHWERFQDSRLIIKMPPGCSLPINFDAIQLMSQQISVDEMRELYSRCIAFVSATSCEGWGLHQHEAMVCGRPVVSVLWGGITEQLGAGESAYIVSHTKRTGAHDFGTVGSWAEPKIESLTEQMDKIRRDPHRALLKGLQASQHMKGFGMQNMTEQLTYILKNVL
jgi:glycosyltransferase involved in cell wall biosynthesis